MITMGFYNTLWKLRTRLEKMDANERDEQDEKTLSLARKWMVGEKWPEMDWHCARERCPFHKDHCKHGIANEMQGL